MSEMDVYKIGDDDSKADIKLDYAIGKFHRRVFAWIVDIVLFLLLGIVILLGVRGIYQTSSTYQKNQEVMDKVMVESGLYIKTESGQNQDIVTYYKNQDISAGERYSKYEKSIDNFIVYMGTSTSQEIQDQIQKYYDEYRLKDTYQNIHYFILDEENKVVANPLCQATKALYSANVYEPFIDSYARGCLTTYNKEYLEANRYFSNILLYIQIPISVILSSLLVFFVPPLIMWRGRKTIGMKIYHLGRVNNKLLNMSIGQYCGYSAAFIVGIIILSCLTFGIPLIISATMMGFSKNKQDFLEYMFQIIVVDDSKEKIYKSYKEIELDYISVDKTPVDFKLENRMDK